MKIIIDGYGNSMGLSNSSRDIKNGEYNTIMGKAKGNINEEYNKPIGSRMPKVNLGNYTGKQIGIKSSKNSNSSKNQRKDSPEIGSTALLYSLESSFIFGANQSINSFSQSLHKKYRAEPLVNFFQPL